MRSARHLARPRVVYAKVDVWPPRDRAGFILLLAAGLWILIIGGIAVL